MSTPELERENAELKAANAALQHEVAELKAANSIMQDQVKMMDAVFNNISDGVTVANKEGEFLFFNPIAEEIVGIGSTTEPLEKWSETYGIFYSDKVTPIPSTELSMYKAIHGEITNEVEVFVRNAHRPNGVFVSVSGRPVYDETGELIGGVVAFRDITQLKKMHEQLEATVNDLQAQNSLMDAVFNSISDGIIVANKEGQYVLVNKTAKEIAGKEVEDTHFREASEKFGLFDPETRQLYPTDELPIARALRGEYAENIEILRHSEQLPRAVHMSISARPIYDENGVVTGAVAAILDISRFKETEARLEVTNDQLTVQTRLLHTIFHSISDGVVVAGETSNIIMANASAKQLLGPIPFLKSSDEWFKPDLYFYPDKVTPFPMEEHPIFQAIWGKSTDGVEMFIRPEETEEGVYASVSGRPMLDNEGNRRGGVAVFHDMTARVKTEEAVAQAFAQGRLEIVDTILHNIGNAINSVAVGIDTIHHRLTNDRLMPRLIALAKAIEAHQDDFSDYVTNDPQGQKIAPFILTLSTDFNAVKQELQQTVQRVKDRSRHIVDIIRTQNSYQDTSGTHKDINLATAISDAIKILQDSIDKRQIQITIDCEKAPQEIRIQESQFHQMLVNLIKNAVEAIDAVEATGEKVEAPRIACRVYIEGGFLCFDITDNGIGIPQEDLKRIFAAGFTTKAYGSGLGLHSSANFVISSGGKIEAFSDGKGKGTTIRTMFRYNA